MRTTLRLLGTAILAFAVAACDGDTPSIDDAQNALKKAGDSAQKVSDFVNNLDTGKVKELAELAAEIEKDPSKAEKLLADHGIDKKQFDDAIGKITSDPEMKKIFDAAKQLASK